MTTSYKLGRTCANCPKPIGDTSKGLCKTCNMRRLNADPELNRRRRESMVARLKSDPKAYARQCATLDANRAKRDPEALMTSGKRLRLYMTPEVIEERWRPRHAAAMRRRRHAWLPDEYRDLYQRMLRSGGFRAPEAKRIILDQIRTDAVRAGQDPEETLKAMQGSRRLLDALRGAAS